MTGRSDTWCNCQAVHGTVNYPGPWHPAGDTPTCPRRTYRHRRFEIAGPLMLAAPPHPKHRIRTSTKKRRACWDAGLHVSVTGDVSTYVGSQAMGIDWMTGNELSQAIPPAYTEYIGLQLIAHLTEQAAYAAARIG